MSVLSDPDESSSEAEELRAKHLPPRVEIHDGQTEVDSPEREPPFAGDPTEPHRSEQLIQQLVEQSLSLIEPEARKVARQLGRLADIDELKSVGRGALFEAARSYDPDRCSFGAYARKRLRWAMFDSVRRATHGRSVAARATALHAAERVVDAATALAPDPTLPESAHARRLGQIVAAQATAMALGLSAPYAERAVSEAPPSSTAGRGTTAPEAREAEARSADRAPPASTPTPEDLLCRGRCAVAMRAALEGLPPTQREILERHYFGEERFDHIAETLGISKSWVSRLHAQAIAALSEALRDHR